MYPQFSKKFVSPMANRPGAPGPSTARSPYFTPTRPSTVLTTGSRMPMDDSVPDSDDDEEAPASIRPDEHDDKSVLDEPVARVKKTSINSLLPGRSQGAYSAGPSRPAPMTTGGGNSDESYWMVQWYVRDRMFAKRNAKTLSLGPLRTGENRRLVSL
jgi:hypothetical protein